MDKEQRLAYLRARVADRPAHARYLEQLIAHYEAGGNEENEPDPTTKAVSWDAQVALTADVKIAFDPPPPPGVYRTENHYGHYRDKTADTHAKRLRTIAARERSEDSLESLLQLPGSEDKETAIERKLRKVLGDD